MANANAQTAQPPAAVAVAPWAAAVAEAPAPGATVPPAQAEAAQRSQAAHQPVNVQPQPIRFRLDSRPAAGPIVPWGPPPSDVQVCFRKVSGPYTYGENGQEFATYIPVLENQFRFFPTFETGTWPVQTLGGHRAVPVGAGNSPPSLRYLSAQAMANSLLLPDGSVAMIEVVYMLFKHQSVFNVLHHWLAMFNRRVVLTLAKLRHKHSHAWEFF